MSLSLLRIKKLLSEDKRKANRLALPIKIFYLLPNETKKIGPVTIVDIGGGGVRFQSKERIKKDTVIDLKIYLPHRSSPVAVKAEVIWCKKVPSPKKKRAKTSRDIYGIGVRFRKMNYKNRREFVGFICENILSIHLTRSGRIKSK